MVKFGLYIAQCFCILLLLCSYFLDVRSDNENDMHFNEHPLTSHYCIHGSTIATHGNNDVVVNTSVSSSEGKTTGKFNIGKHKSFESILPLIVFQPQYVPTVVVEHAVAMHPDYAFLYYKVIDPPPPKWC